MKAKAVRDVIDDRCQVGRQEITLLRALLEPSKMGHLGGSVSSARDPRDIHGLYEMVL